MAEQGDGGGDPGEQQEERPAQPGGSGEQSTQENEGYPPTPVSFEGDDVAIKGEQPSTGDAVDLSEGEAPETRAEDAE